MDAVDLPSQPLADLDPEFQTMALETGSRTYALAGTSVREKLLQNLTNDVCRLQLGLAFRLHVQAAAMHGISFADLLSLLRFVAPYAGYPAAADALSRLGELAGDFDFGDGGESDENTPDADLATDRLESDDSWMREFLADRTGRSWREAGLSGRECAIVTLTSDVGMRTLGSSFSTHVQLALEAGMTAAEVRDVVRFCAEMSVAATIDALHELEDILPPDGSA